jgi:ABC-type uncharacterized transport system permease subunit
MAIEMGPLGISALVIGAMLLGVGSQALGEGPVSHEWLVTAAGALVGGLVGSEWLFGWQAIRPVWDGVAVVPAMFVGLFAAGATNVLFRTVHHDLAARAAALRERMPSSLPAVREPNARPVH